VQPASSPADAARAAVAAATGLGLTGLEPVILADGSNLIVHLTPAPLVAKIPASNAALRPGVGARLGRELELAVFLAAAGAPVMPPSAEVPAVVHHADGHPMTFWTYLPPTGAGRPDEATIGSMLRDLHSVLRGYQAPLPALLPALAGQAPGDQGPLADIPRFLARRPTSAASRSLVGDADAAVLAAAFDRLTAELAAAMAAGTPVQPLHGDAGIMNLMAADGGWVWHDFEEACAGPAGWDLAATTASPRLDRGPILAAYGDHADGDVVRTCEQLRRLHLTIWYALYAERLPECRPRAAELLATWR
jgi:hypothetical protein